MFALLIVHFKVRWLLRKRKADRLWWFWVSSLRQIQAHQGEYCDQVHFEAARAQVDRNCCWGSAETSHVGDSASSANWQAREYHCPSRVVRKLSRVHLDLRPTGCSQRSVWWENARVKNLTIFLDFISDAGKLSESVSRNFFRQIVSAIDYCHRWL